MNGCFWRQFNCLGRLVWRDVANELGLELIVPPFVELRDSPAEADKWRHVKIIGGAINSFVAISAEEAKEIVPKEAGWIQHNDTNFEIAKAA